MLYGFRRTLASRLRHLGSGVALLSATTSAESDFSGLCVVGGDSHNESRFRACDHYYILPGRTLRIARSFFSALT